MLDKGCNTKHAPAGEPQRPSLPGITISRKAAVYLLRELDDLRYIVNRDDEITCQLYEVIASQLWGVDVSVERSTRKVASKKSQPATKKPQLSGLVLAWLRRALQ